MTAESLNSISLFTIVLSATKSPHRKLLLVRIPCTPELCFMPRVFAFPWQRPLNERSAAEH